MIAREFKKEDYKTVCEWWKQYNQDVMPLDLLSDTGYIVDDIAAVWLYTTNSKSAIITHPVTNNKWDKKIRYRALAIALRACEKKAKEGGIYAIVTFVNLKGLQDMFEKHEYQVSEYNMIELIKII